MPSLSLETIHSVLRRQDYGSERERAAETFADLLLVEAMLPKRSASRFRNAELRRLLALAEAWPEVRGPTKSP